MLKIKTHAEDLTVTLLKNLDIHMYGPLLSTKGPFVQFDLPDSKLIGNNHKKPLDNYYNVKIHFSISCLFFNFEIP